MAQSEDTELRDLVIEALEKNGSLAKIRALLRANVFLAFEEDYDNIRQNINLDNVLEVPEGVLALSIVYEFLEFCNLKNTLFVYMSESREGKQYRYEGRNMLADKLNLDLHISPKQPLLLSLLKKTYKPTQKNNVEPSTNHIRREKLNSDNFRDDQNCTYIVHEDSSSTSSHSQSDQSSEEKNKLMQKLQFDNSDTDTSNDSMHGKTSAEYVANQHINIGNEQNYVLSSYQPFANFKSDKIGSNRNDESLASLCLEDLKLSNSSESTSYLNLKPYSAAEKRQMNTTGIPITEPGSEQNHNVSVSLKQNNTSSTHQNIASKEETKTTETLNSVSSMSDEEKKTVDHQNVSQASEKLSIDNTEYSLDFTSSPVSNTKANATEDAVNSSGSVQENLSARSEDKPSENGSLHRYSSSQSSISISDVADLIENSENNQNVSKNIAEEIAKQNLVKNKIFKNKFEEDTSISESSVPSLSNISIDIHSD